MVFIRGSPNIGTSISVDTEEEALPKIFPLCCKDQSSQPQLAEDTEDHRGDSKPLSGTSGAWYCTPHFRSARQAIETTDLVLSVTSSNPTAKLPGSVGSPGETLSLKESHDDRSPSLVDLEVVPRTKESLRSSGLTLPWWRCGV